MKAAALLALAIAGCIGGAAAKPFDPFASATIEQKSGAQIPLDLAFRDEQDRPVTLRAIGGGRPVVLAPVLHHCPNICGVTLGGLADAVAEQTYRAGPDFTVVAFGIDPKETPEDARKSVADLEQRASAQTLAGGLHALTGDAGAVAAVTDALGYRYAWDESIGQYAHVAAIAVLTPDGRLARWLYGLAPQPGDLALALTDAGQGRIGGLAEKLLLLCYRYDPVSGRYTGAIWSALRIGGGLASILLLGSIAFALIRERRYRRRAG